MKKLHALAVAGSLYASLASAEVQINGFGQVVGGAVTRGEGLRTVPYDTDISFAPESLLGLQLTAPLTDRWDATGQLVARGRDDYEPEFTWAYLRYQINAHWSLKLGRQRIPRHRYSDYVEVGAAYPFLRPPQSIYALELNDFDGLNLTGSYVVGDWALTAHVPTGTARNVGQERGGPATELETRTPWGVVLVAGYQDWLQLRANYWPFEASLRHPGLTRLVDALRASGEADVARELDFEDERGVYRSLGAELQMRGWTIGSEYSEIDLDDTVTGPRKGYSTMLAYRWRDWTPVVVYGRRYGGPGLDAVNAMNPRHRLFPVVEALTARYEIDDRYLSVGARYDITETLALKLDYTHRESRSGDRGSSGVLASGLVFTF